MVNSFIFSISFFYIFFHIFLIKLSSTCPKGHVPKVYAHIESCPINGYMPIVESNLLSSIYTDSPNRFTFTHNFIVTILFNSKSPIFTQNYLLQITISLAKSNNLRSHLEVKQSHNKFNLHTIPNNSLHLNPAIFQIPLSHLPLSY